MIGQEHLSPRSLDFLYIGQVKLNEWVKAARTHKGMTQEQLGERLGVTKGNVSGWENGRHEPSYSQLLRVQEVTGYRLDPRMDLGYAEFEKGYVAAPPSMAPILSWEHEDDLPAGEYVLIPRLDVKLSAGPGGEQQLELDFVKTQAQAFRTDWIRKRRLKPSKLAVMSADGDSMEERIQDGDALVVDTSQTDVVDGKVYALWYDGGERVKRLFRLPGGGLRIKSDNPSHGTIEMGPDYHGHVRIIGRVVQVAGEGGL